MKIIKNISVVVILILLPSLLIPFHSKHDNLFLWIIIFLIVAFFIFNLIIRKSLSFKNYFTSKFNLFTNKVRYKKTFDLPNDLMYQKVIEVINDSKFKLADTDKEKFEILAISTMSAISWGENLYIDFETKGNETIMHFCSTTFFQMYDWGKNEKNYTVLLNEIESSLTI